MFDFVRKHTRLALGFVLLLIIPSFVFFGVEGYTRYMGDEARTMASVDGRRITRAEWDAEHRRNVEEMRRRMPGVDAKLLDSTEFKRETLDNMVRERVLVAAADALALVPGNERLQTLFWNDPQFAPLRNPDGRTINRDLLAAQGMSEEAFVQRLRVDYGLRQVLGGVQRSAVASATAASQSFGAWMQRREVQLQRFDAAAYLGKVSPVEADIEAYYKANETAFKAPERAEVEYVVLDAEALMKGITVPREDLEKYYQENASRYTAAEERRASHILVKADAEMPAAERSKAKARAEQLLAQVRKDPKSFAELARKSSEDPGSAAQGGDLDFIGRGMMVKPFEDAVFAMKEGEISNVVETQFGYHVIQLTGLRGGQKRPFDDVRAEIEVEVRKQLGQRRYAEAAEQFSNTVYEQSDSLQPVVDKLKLEKRTATVERTPRAGATGALASAKLLDAVFGAESVRTKRNTEAVEVGPNQLAAARIVTHTPARVLPLAEVRDRVRERVQQAQAAALARKEGQARLAALQANPQETLPQSLTLSRAEGRGPLKPIVDEVLRVAPGKLPAALGVELGNDGYVVVKVLRVAPTETPPGGDAPLRAQFAQAWGDAEAQAYLAALKKRYKAEVKPAAAAAASAPAS